jgi:hypothetical protein
MVSQSKPSYRAIENLTEGCIVAPFNPEFPFSTLTALRSIHLTGTEGNCRSGSGRSVSPVTAQRASFGSTEAGAARN